LPAEDRFKLCHRRSSIGGTRCRYFSDAMSRARYTGSTAGISDRITETFFGKGIAAFTGNEREVTTRTGS